MIPVIAAPDCSLNLGLRVQIPDHDVLTLKPEGQQPTVCATPSLSQFTPSVCNTLSVSSLLPPAC